MRAERPDASVLIPVRNGVPLLTEQLDALSTQDYAGRFEVVVADNGSTDGTPDLVRGWDEHLEVRVVDAGERVGVSHARNVGVRASRSDLILVCDADDQVSPGWVSRMVDALQRYDVVGGPRRVDRLNAPHVIAWYPAPVTDRLPTSGGFLPYAVGANCAFRRAVFEAIGGYSEDLILGADDLDFSWRAQLAGFAIGFADEAWVDYRLRSSLRSLYRQMRVRAQGAAALRDRFGEQGYHPATASVPARVMWLVTRAPFAVIDRRRRGVWVRSLASLHGQLSASPRVG